MTNLVYPMHRLRSAKARMPLFEPDSLRALVGDCAEDEQTLDLPAVSPDRAQSTVSQMLERSPSDEATSFVIRIDPATATSGETLFLPIGRQLLEANGGGFYVELPGHSRHDETQHDETQS